MLEDHVRIARKTCRRVRSGPATDYVDGFADWLHAKGYAPKTLSEVFRFLADWLEWMTATGFADGDWAPAFDAFRAAVQKRPRMRNGRGVSHAPLAAAALFMRFLEARGIVSLPAAPSRYERWPILGEFGSWMRRHRGLAETTLAARERILERLLGVLGDEPRLYTAEAMRAFVLEQARPNGIAWAKCIVTAVRSFLRFLGATGRCPPGLERAVPGFASWQLSSLPRFIGAEDVERVIDSCRDDPRGLRDRAVLLLLARLGLRSSDVTRLTFDDIDWQNGRIAVCGKGRRQEWLPLPQDVGAAILRFLRQGRPPLAVPHIFTKLKAPLRSLRAQSVSVIVDSAIRRAGVDAPTHGAHLLRHSAATTMLRQGASLAGIGAVLRHRSLRTTAHYAKVDFGPLSEIAQPWPEVQSCS